MKRHFIAIPFAKTVRDCLVSIQPATCPGMRRIRFDDFHLTLHFLGNLRHETADLTRRVLQSVKTKPFVMTLDGLGLFSAHGHPRVLWVGVESNPRLQSLHAAIGAALNEAVGFEPEQRPYSPHVTLARFDGTQSHAAINDYVQETPFKLAGIAVEQFVMYSSTQKNGKWEYHEEAVFPLE